MSVSTLRARVLAPAGWSVDQVTAAVAAATLGVGVVIALAGAVTASLPLVLTGAGAACAGTFLLLVAEWVDGLALLMLTLPLPALISTETTRFPVAAPLSGLVVGAWLVRRLLDPEPLRLGDLPRRSTLLFAASVLISALFAIDPPSAVREIVNLGVMIGLFVIATDRFGRAPDSALTVVRMVAVAAGLAGFAALLETFDVIPGQFPLQGTPFFRAVVGYGQPNESGMYFSLALPLCVCAFQTSAGRTGRALGAGAIVGCLVGLMCTFSRASWIAVALAPLALAFTGAGRSAARAWLWGALGVVAFDVVSGGALSNRFISLFGDWVVDQRAALMLVGVLMFVDHPIVGVGPGGFPAGLQQYGPRVANLWDYVGSAHNGYVEIAAQLGTIGLLGFTAMVLLTLRNALRNARAAGSQGDGSDPLAPVRRAAAWSFMTTFLVTFTIWPLSHGMGQLMMVVAAMGVARPPGAQQSA